jgi:hypothetical protein
MTLSAQQPPDDRVTRTLEVVQDDELRRYTGIRLAQLNRRRRALDAKKKEETSAIRAEEKKLDVESVSLEAAPTYANGTKLEMVFPCVGRVNQTTMSYDIYRVVTDEKGEERLTFVKSEPLPDKYSRMLQPELPFDKKDKKDGANGKSGKKDGANGKGADAPPDYPDA